MLHTKKGMMSRYHEQTGFGLAGTEDLHLGMETCQKKSRGCGMPSMSPSTVWALFSAGTVMLLMVFEEGNDK